MTFESLGQEILTRGPQPATAVRFQPVLCLSHRVRFVKGLHHAHHSDPGRINLKPVLFSHLGELTALQSMSISLSQ